MNKPVIGIIGAGKLGTTLGGLAVGAGYPVLISGSKSAEDIELTVDILVPGATACENEEISRRADIIILALPLGKYSLLDPAMFKDKLLIDAMNYWWEVEGTHQVYSDAQLSSSQRVQQHFLNSTVIKAFNHIGYHNLADDAHPDRPDQRKAVLIAGDREEAVAAVKTIVSDLGFAPLYIGPLKNGIVLEPGSPLFGASLIPEDIARMDIIKALDAPPG